MKYRIEDHPGFDVVGWSLRVTTVQGENFVKVPGFWQQCHAEGKVDALAAYCGPLGMLGLCAEMDPQGEWFTYLIGVEKRAGAVYPAGTQALTVPVATYVVFSAVGPMPGAVQDAWKFAHGTWFPSSGYVHAGSPDFEVYPAFPEGDERGDVTSPRCYTEVWIPIRKRG